MLNVDTTQSDLLKSSAQGYLNQGNQPNTSNPLESANSYLGLSQPNSANIGLPQASANAPINQQSLTMPSSIPVSSSPPPFAGPTYVAGVGFMGPDLGGYVKGAQALQQYQLGAAANQRANEELGMSKIKLAQDQDYINMAKDQLGINLNQAAMTTKTFEQQQAIQQGMRDAADQGGFTGVINYLTTADPVQALNFQASKLKLDDMIRQNDIAQASMPNQMSKVMFDSYQMGAKMAAGIMNLPPQLQGQAYQQMLPMIKKIIPDAPDEYNDQAKSIGMLMMAQGTPENLLFANQGLQAYINTDIGKYNIADATLANKGIPSDDPRRIEIKNKIAALDAQAKSTAIQGANAGLDILNKQLDGVNKLVQMNTSYATKLQEASKPFIDKMSKNAELYNLANYVQQAQAKGDNTGSAEGMLKLSAARTAEGARPSLPEIQQIQAAAGIPELTKPMISWMRGEKVNLLPREVTELVQMQKYLALKDYNQQLVTESEWKKNAEQYFLPGPDGQLQQVIDWNKMPLPSKTYENMINPNSNQQSQQQMTKNQIDNYVSEGYTSGKYTPQQLEGARQQLYQQNNINTPNQSPTNNSMNGASMPNGTAIQSLGIGG